MTRALLVIDVQRDFCEGGALAVQGGNAVAEGVRKHIEAWGEDYAVKAASLDWHNAPPDTNAGHFALEGEPDFVQSWPVHCVGQSRGAGLHPILDKQGIWDELVRKGRGCQSYSAFEGVTWDGQRTLLAALRTKGVTDIDVCGLATDYCVRASVLDARGLGFKVRVLTRLTAAVSAETEETAINDMLRAGASMVG